MVREYLIKKGLKLFHDLNENLNAYKQNFEKEKIIKNKQEDINKFKIIHKNGEKFVYSHPTQHDYKQWE